MSKENAIGLSNNLHHYCTTIVGILTGKVVTYCARSKTFPVYLYSAECRLRSINKRRANKKAMRISVGRQYAAVCTAARLIQMSSHNIREFPVNQMQSREMRSAAEKPTINNGVIFFLKEHCHLEFWCIFTGKRFLYIFEKVPFFRKFDGAQKICQITILNLKFWNYTWLWWMAANQNPAFWQKTRENSNDEFNIVKRHFYLSL